MVRLDPGITDRMAVVTHVHTDYDPTGDPDHCSGKQSVEDVYRLGQELGFMGVATAEHSGIPATGRLSRIPDDPKHPLYGGLVHRMLSQYQSGLEAGVEANILPDGTIDVPASLVELCRAHDTSLVVIASQHGLDQADEKDPVRIKRRLITAMSQPHVDVIGHPTRNNDDVPGIDWPAILEVAARTGTAIELNFNQWRKWSTQRSEKTVEERADWRDTRNVAAISWYHGWNNWLPMVAESGAAVSYGLDIHDRSMWPDASEPGSPTAGDLLEFFEQVEAAGIASSRVINRSYYGYKQWLAAPKHQRGLLVG